MTEAITAHATTAVGDRVLALDLEAGAGEVVALVGPNGAGKSTAVELLLGLRRVADGAITLGGNVVDDGATFTAPEDRRLGWSPQGSGLLPRLTVRQQVERFARQGEVAGLLRVLGIDHLADRRPDGLSGGEAQRVAVARALASSPVVLLDEPTSAQDPRGAALVRRAVIAHRQAGGTVVVVSHRPEDAWLIADHAVVLDDLATVQRGRAADLAAHPATPWVAAAAGMVVLRGDVGEDHVLRTAEGTEVVVPAGTGPGPAAAVVRREAITLHRTVPAGSSARNVLRATVAEVQHTATGVLVELDAAHPLTATVTPEAVEELGLAPGVDVWATWKASEVHVHRL